MKGKNYSTINGNFPHEILLLFEAHQQQKTNFSISFSCDFLRLRDIQAINLSSFFVRTHGKKKTTKECTKTEQICARGNSKKKVYQQFNFLTTERSFLSLLFLLLCRTDLASPEPQTKMFFAKFSLQNKRKFLRGCLREKIKKKT